ncbi:EAL domain-containing protein [Rhizobium sp. KVB221]|uniref:EAL domain-containing protein n=1 Tax=Rhizobium setariae TaxID=2801340 RepID=A0A937CQX0_9HYPH|nr:EAL domain-containing protein [Rhizobium setariae]MBL0375054.1 EAL domain-containing protein [Rhizobium setariae]
MSEAVLKLFRLADLPEDGASAETGAPPDGSEPPILRVLRQPDQLQDYRPIDSLDDAKAELSQLQGVLKAYRAALDQHAIVAITNRAGKIVHVNDMFCSVSGYEREELIGQPHRIVNSGHHPREFFSHMWHTIARGDLWHSEICNRAKDGSLYWVDTTIVPLAGQDGRVEGYVSVRYDITKRKAAEAVLKQEVELRRNAEELLVDVIETVPDGIAAFDTDDRLILFNKSYRDCLSRSQDVIEIGSTFESILRHGLEHGQYSHIRNTPEAREAWVRARLKEHRNPSKTLVQSLSDGRWLQIRERRSASGHVVGTRTDITEIKRSEAAIKFHAEHDPLTGLLNRSVLADRLGEALAGSERTGQAGALMVLDLDGFKAINDTMGHSAGDMLLVAVARRLAEAVRKSDTVVRLGGDEFAIILPNAGSKLAAGKAAMKLLSAVRQPMTIQRRIVTPQISIGISIFPQHGRNVETLLKNADISLYQSKAAGRGTYKIYSREMRAGIDQRRRLSHALDAAVATNTIDIALQPQFALDGGAHVGFEVLARWKHNGTQISPADFIPIAEETGLITELGHQVLRKAMDHARQIKRKSAFTGTVAVNVASAQLRQPDFPLKLERMVAQYGLSPRDIEIELTENILLDDRGSQIDLCLQRLNAMGFPIALDDFGTGYASLAHLSRLPVSRLKIDRTFILNMCEDDNAATIVQATVGLAHSLGMRVVAEGIETEAQLSRLQACNCDFGQGYLLSRPLEPAAVSTFMQERKGTRGTP